MSLTNNAKMFVNTLSRVDRVDLQNIIRKDLIRNGISETDVSILDPYGVLTQSMNSMYDKVLNCLLNQQRESNLLTAISKSTLLNQLAQHINEISLSTPSSLEIHVHIPIHQIKTLGKLVQTDTYEISYSDANKIDLDGKIFIPMHDNIKIRATFPRDGSPVKVKVYRDISATEKFLYTVQKITIDGVEKAIFREEFVQIEREIQEKIFSSDEIDRFIVSVDKPIHNFVFRYKENRNSPGRVIKKRMFYSRGLGEYLQYTLLSNTSFAIDYEYIQGGFKPEKNGVLEVIIEKTTGENVKFNEKPTIVETFPKTLKVDYSPIDDYFESKGGRLSSDGLEDLRNYIIKLKGSRGRIDTEDDLGTFLLNYGGSSIFRPKLIISDVERIFSVYVGLNFTNKLSSNTTRKFTIPTSSGDILVDFNSLPSKTYKSHNYHVLKPTNKVISRQTSDYSTYYVDPSISLTPSAGVYVYEYVFPFIGSFDSTDNFMRVYMDNQYTEAYESICIYDTDSNVETRFINTYMRMEDFEDVDNPGNRIFRVRCRVRADNTEFKIQNNVNSKFTLTLQDDLGNPFKIKASDVIDLGDENKYDVIFDIKTDRNVYNSLIDVDVLGDGSIIKPTAVKQKLIFECMLHDSSTGADVTVVKFESEVELLKEVTAYVMTQTTIDYNGKLIMTLAPLIAYNFYEILHNREVIVEELNNIINFLNSDIYTDLELRSPEGKNLNDLQETNFTIALKFVKTYGCSKFIELKGHGSPIPLNNLQLYPKLNVRKKDSEYDLSAISDYINNTLLNHDYFNEDLHMNKIVKDVLDNASEYIYMLDFLNLDSYTPDFTLIAHNDKNINNSDVPELISIEPKYNENTKLYEYKIEYFEI